MSKLALLEAAKAVTSSYSAAQICAAFFAAMDFDGSGSIEAAEAKTISTVAFDESTQAADKCWKQMLKDMDKDHDEKISKAEYTAWWKKTTADKVQADGTFVAGYAKYLLSKLALLEANKKLVDGRAEEGTSCATVSLVSTAIAFLAWIVTIKGGAVTSS